MTGYRSVWIAAVRTDEGIERRFVEISDSPADNPWVRLANIEYDPKDDRVLAVVLAVVGIAGFAAIPFADGDVRTVTRLALLGLFGVTVSLMTIAQLSMR
ncbi:MAG: hypothetical protein IH933_07305 [Euryarchaeota archaeon]|nr:hypothetical protein [Euryarchaeota archaeon]